MAEEQPSEEYEDGVELADDFCELIDDIDGDRKKLLQDSRFATPTGLRDFIANYVMARLSEIVEITGRQITENFDIANENAHMMLQFRSYMFGLLRERFGMTFDENVIDGALNPEKVQALYEAIAAVGVLTTSKLGDDEEMKQAHVALLKAFFEAMGMHLPDGLPDDLPDGVIDEAAAVDSEKQNEDTNARDRDADQS